MPAARLDILIEKGATFELPFVLQDPNGVPIDLTGCTLKSQIRKNTSDPNLVVQFTSTIVSAPAGTGKISLTSVQTLGIAVEPAGGPVRRVTPMSWDLQITYADTTVERLLEGVANISPEVTQ